MLPAVIGHRGARSLFPENTMEGLLAAFALGVRHFEIDVAMTRDGVVVLSHDPRLKPAITRRGPRDWLQSAGPRIHALDYAALGAFDVGRIRPGSVYARAFPRQQGVDGARIPTLQAALGMDRGISWTIEIKTSPRNTRLTAAPEAIAEAVVAVADACGATSRIVVQSFDWRGPRHLRRWRPDVALAWLTCRATRAWRGGQRALPATVAGEGGGLWSPKHTELTRHRLDLARRAGLRVVPWTVNDRASALRLARWGVDGMITDDPVALAGWLHV